MLRHFLQTCFLQLIMWLASCFWFYLNHSVHGLLSLGVLLKNTWHFPLAVGLRFDINCSPENQKCTHVNHISIFGPNLDHIWTISESVIRLRIVLSEYIRIDHEFVGYFCISDFELQEGWRCYFSRENVWLYQEVL